MTQKPPLQVVQPRDLSLLATQSTPAVEANWDAGLLRMEGESYPENTYDVYVSIVAWVDSCLIASNRPLRVELHLDYLNTSSIRAMIDIFDRLQVASDAGRELSVHWLYDSRNPRSAELGEEFKEDYSFMFTIQAAPLAE